MKRIFVTMAMVLACMGAAQETYLGLYLQGNKLGYSSYKQTDDQLDGKAVKRNDSRTVLNAALLGAAMQMEIQSVSWSDANGRPLKMRFVNTSAGRTQTLDAIFKGQEILLDIVNNGAATKKTLKIPAGGMIVDDPLTPMVTGGLKAGSSQTFYILDPTTASLIKNEIQLKGAAQVDVKGKKVQATRVDVIDPRANTTMYLSAKGDLIKAEGPMGIEMIPETMAEATGSANSTGYRPSIDLALVTSIKTDKPIKDPATLGFLKMRITGRNLSKLPSDVHQTIAGSGEKWLVTVHPPKQADFAGLTIAEAAKAKPGWIKPTHLIPSDTDEFKALAKQIVGGETNVKKAALKIRAYVQQNMRANAGIGVLRDASEVLKTKEGVCRDYAILTATLMRAAGIPAQLCSGLVNWDGSFYYHAWVEVWDGKRWIGMDSTVPNTQISATHVKLGNGNVEEAFTFTFLDKVKIEVMEARR